MNDKTISYEAPEEELLRGLIRDFGQEFNLSPRETEVFGLLPQQIISLKDIAVHLGLSPHTVSNHFKSIFEKTDTGSRAELLSLFLKRSVERTRRCHLLHRKPRVMVLDDESEIGELLSEELVGRGMIVYPYSDPAQALEALPGLKLDAIISDIRMPRLTGVQLLQEIRRAYHYSPAVILITGFSGNHPDYQLLDMGATAVLDKPVDMGKLFSLIVESFIDDRTERNRLLRIEDQIPTVIDHRIELRITNIGFGGVFIPIDPENMPEELQQSLKVGSMISFEFPLQNDEAPIRTKGEIVWKRTAPQNDLKPGIGVKFVDMSESDRKRIDDYVRTRKILSYIPMGS